MQSFEQWPVAGVQVFGGGAGIPGDVRQVVTAAGEVDFALQAADVEVDVFDAVQRVEGGGAFEGERRVVSAARVAVHGYGEAVKRAFGVGAALF